MCFKCKEVNLDRRNFLINTAKAAAAMTLLSWPRTALGLDSTVEKVLENGPAEHRFNVVMLPEGYTVKDRKQFDTDVEKFVKGLDNYTAYKELKPWFNFSKIWVPSDGKYTGDGSGAFKVKNDADGVPTQHDKEKSKEMKELAKADLPYIMINDPTVAGFTRQTCAIGTTKLEVAVHEFGHVFGLGDEYMESSFAKAGIALNTSLDKENPPWKPLIGKVKGIKTVQIPGTNAFRGEEDATCLMNDIDPKSQLGPLCYNGILLYLRETKVPVIQKATDEGIIQVAHGKPTGIEATVIPSLTYIPTAQAWYVTGDKEKMDSLAQTVKDTFAADKPDKEWKKATVTFDKKTRKYSVTNRLPPGAHTLALYVKDQNPAILLDPKKATTTLKVYRIDVA